MRPVGRPKTDTESLNLRLPRLLIDAIDEVRRVEKDLPNRQEMIRQILTDYVQRHGFLPQESGDRGVPFTRV